MREHVEAMQAIWRDDEASYAGRHVHFERIWSWPKPVQRPGPPILVGGNGKGVLDRVLAYGDHWMPNVVGGDDVLLARVEELRSRADRPIGVTVNAAPSRPERLERYAEAGVERCVFYVPSAGAGRRRGEDRARARLRRAGRPQIAASSSAESPSRPRVASGPRPLGAEVARRARPRRS